MKEKKHSADSPSRNFEYELSQNRKFNNLLKAVFLIKERLIGNYEYKEGDVCRECGAIPKQFSLMNIITHNENCLSGILYDLKHKNVLEINK